MLDRAPEGFERTEWNRGVEWVLPGVEKSLWLVPIAWVPIFAVAFFYTGGDEPLASPLHQAAVTVTLVLVGRFALYRRQKVQAVLDGLLFDDTNGERIRVPRTDILGVDVRRREAGWRLPLVPAKHAEIVVRTPGGDMRIPCHLGTPDNASWFAYELQQQFGVEGLSES